jgi:hypothetical protein
MEMSGFLSPAAAKMSITPSATIALDTICLTAKSRSACGLPGVIVVLLASSEQKNNENLIVIKSTDLATTYEQEFHNIWNKST